MRRAADHRVLCAIARAVIQADRTIDVVEWQERTKERLVDQGWALPRPHRIGAALDAVTCVLRKSRV
jgi:hypothetical protein